MSKTLFVSGIHTIPEYPPMGLAMCMAYVKQELNPSRVQFSDQFIRNEEQLRNLFHDERPKANRRHILLFSNYLWNSKINLRLSLLGKQLDPDCVTIHGGPNTPTYTEASKEFLLSEPHVDFIVAGEGEETLKELLEALIQSVPLEKITISGLRYLCNGTFVETAHRSRADNINKFPSPYLSGFFDKANAVAWHSATIETFRGCPYGCTYCDWGSAMGSKIKVFDLDRVFREIEWIASRKVTTIWIADSNFGIFPRFGDRKENMRY